MSKKEYLNTTLDQIYKSHDIREPTYKVLIWNPNRTNIQDVVLGKATSPQYDISDHVKRIDYKENIVFESGDDAIATHCTLALTYDPNNTPIPIDQTTLLDSTPIRIYQGDYRTSQMVLLFTGVIRGNPSVMVYSAEQAAIRDINIAAVGRAESCLNRVVTARSYAQGDDIGKAAVETAIKFAYLDRREINIGYQGYTLQHSQNQLVDIEVLKGINQMLFCVGKKPRFDNTGHLIAADTDLDKAPTRTYNSYDLFKLIQRQERQESIYNSTRLLGLDNNLTEIVEREKRLAHGQITSGFFDSEVSLEVWFSESEGKRSGGRKAKDTRLKEEIHSFEIVGGNMSWTPYLESDGYTCFGGKLEFDTGFAPEIKTLLLSVYSGAMTTKIVAIETKNDDLKADMEYVIKGAMIAIISSMWVLGRVEWEIYGKPIQNVYQQLCATAQLNGVLSGDIRELERRNDWIYNISTLKTRAKALLKRELIKGWTYQIVMLDDPIIEVDDIINIKGEKYYITSIEKSLQRVNNSNIITLTAWRVL